MDTDTAPPTISPATPSAELRIMAVAERLLAVALATTFVAVIVVGRMVDPLVLGPCTALATALVWFGPRLRSDTRLHLLLSMVFVIDVALTFVYLDGYGVDIVWLFVLPMGAGLLGRWQHIAVWSTAVAVAFLLMFLESSPTHLMWHNPTTLPNLVGTSAILFLTGYAMLWSRRQRENELRAAIVEARELAEKRSAAEQLARANVAARQRFLATMSHELRTPMTGVLLATDSIDTDQLSDENANIIEAIRTSANSLVGILNEVLDIARMERDGEGSRREPFQILELFEGVAAVTAPAASNKHMTLVVDLPPEMEAVWIGDEPRLRRVLSNLTHHAIEQTSFGAVRLRAEPTEEGVRFAIDDTGGGLDPLVEAAVFNPAKQTELVPDSLGTSLHLTIARDLVTAMGGTLTVRSQPLVGATFEFEIATTPAGPNTLAQVSPDPAIEDLQVELVSNAAWAIDAGRRWAQHWGATVVERATIRIDLDETIDGAAPCRRVASLAAALHPPSLVRPTGRTAAKGTGTIPRRCLVVDDDRVTRMMIETALALHGHSTVAAGNGAEALAILDREPIDIMFVDLTMPVMDGIETIRHIRSGTTGGAALPICVVSGTSSERHQVLALGADRFVLKPSSVAELAAAVDELVPSAHDPRDGVGPAQQSGE